MSESYLALSRIEQAEIIRGLSIRSDIKREAILLEKDIWLCWALQYLFKMPNRLPMAFKGGTSLSKVFGLIDRFSEDIDITINYQAFDCDNPFEDGISKTKLKNISQEIKSMLTEHLKGIIVPYYEAIISDQFKVNSPSIELDSDGETIYLYYPSVIEQKSGYVIDAIRLEFGGRNLTIPNETHAIKTDISKYVDNLEFPEAVITVLSPQKTFWEKITLIHYECNRPNLKNDADRISRHWYDIVMLANSDIGKEAIKNHGLLSEVVKIKKTFYDANYANYDDCLVGKLRLIPNHDCLELLKGDFNIMLREGMFYGEQPEFGWIIDEIKKIEDLINKGGSH